MDIKQSECTIYECIIDRADVREALHDTEIDTLKVISSHINLVGAEIEMLNLKNRLNPALEIEGFLLTMYDSRLRLANQIYDEVKRHFQELVFNTVIQRNVKLSEAPSYGLPTILYDADSTGAKNHNFAKELISRNEKK